MRRTVRKRPPLLSHQWIDVVNLAMHRAIVRKLRRDPKLYDRARRTLARWEKAQRGCPPPLREWRDILCHNNRETVLRMLTRRTQEADRLRSIAPFCDILTAHELKAIWARYDKTTTGKTLA